MGYYTNYSITIMKDPNKEEDSFWEAFDELTHSCCSKEFINYGVWEAKWYNWQDDMVVLSRKFPQMLIQLEGDGEEPLDIWVATFCNGECNYRELQTHWEEFDSEEFYNSNKS